MIGQLFVHTLNVLLSSLGSLASEGENNPCSLYFLNIAIDTTLGESVYVSNNNVITHRQKSYRCSVHLFQHAISHTLLY